MLGTFACRKAKQKSSGMHSNTEEVPQKQQQIAAVKSRNKDPLQNV